MSFEVTILDEAQEDIDRIYGWIASEAPDAALDWYMATYQAIETLKDFPERCPLVEDADPKGIPIRMLIRGNYLILFRFDSIGVFVLHVRHAGRQPNNDR
jgi:plasmid stabilization system protein ParE